MSTLTPTAQSTAIATWYTQRGGNDTWFRCDAPAEAVGGKVSYLTDKQIDRATSYPNNNTGLRWTAAFLTDNGAVRTASTKKEWTALTKQGIRYTDVKVVFPRHEGVAVWTRPDGRRAMIAAQMAEQGIMTIAETDDNYLAEGHWNLTQRQVDWDDEAIGIICRATASFDRNIFSTRWLRDRYHREYRERLGKGHLPEMFICRNHIPRDAWPKRDEGDGRLRVGFMGSTSHIWDVNMAYTAIHAAHEYAGAETVMIGYNPAKPDDEPDEMEINGELVQLRSEKSKMFRSKWGQVVDRHIKWVDPGVYHRASLPLDIGLAPISTANDFTLGKSDAKALEYTISGAACVLSGAGIYHAGGWRHEVNCLMAGSQQDMARETLRLCKDAKLRFELVTAAQEMVLNERNEDVMRDEWMAALS